MSEGSTMTPVIDRDKGFTHTLKSERLQAETGWGVSYRGTRFDWSGFTTQITLDNSFTFCRKESLIPGQGTGGEGLCNEFDINGPENYAAAEAGGSFLKIGVGVLKKPDASAYGFTKPYEAVPVVPEVSAASNKIVFKMLSPSINGYGYLLEKTLSVAGNALEITYRLRNTGEKAFVTEEYTHNFFGISNKPIGPDYTLDFKGSYDWQPKVGDFILQDGTVSWPATPEEAFYAQLNNSVSFKECRWELRNNAIGAGIRELGDFPVVRAALWGTGHVVSPEIFAVIALKPDEEKSWCRRYEFFTL